MAINSVPARQASVAAYQAANTYAFEDAMSQADGKWDDFVSDSSVSDQVKIAAAELLAKLVEALGNSRTVQDTKDLDGSFAAAHTLASQPELIALIQGISQLDPAQQATLERTIARLGNGELELKPDGAVLRPRQIGQGQPNQGQPAPQQPNPAPQNQQPNQGQPAPQQPNPAPRGPRKWFGGGN